MVFFFLKEDIKITKLELPLHFMHIAIIAHVDHGKTTLVDKIIHACETLDKRKDHGELILDNNDLELILLIPLVTPILVVK